MVLVLIYRFRSVRSSQSNHGVFRQPRFNGKPCARPSRAVVPGSHITEQRRTGTGHDGARGSGMRLSIGMHSPLTPSLVEQSVRRNHCRFDLI